MFTTLPLNDETEIDKLFLLGALKESKMPDKIPKKIYKNGAQGKKQPEKEGARRASFNLSGDVWEIIEAAKLKNGWTDNTFAVEELIRRSRT